MYYGAGCDRRRGAETIMIDHISIAVRDLEAGGRFYEAVLAPLGYSKMIARATTIGFGKNIRISGSIVRADMATP